MNERPFPRAPLPSAWLRPTSFIGRPELRYKATASPVNSSVHWRAVGPLPMPYSLHYGATPLRRLSYGQVR